MVASELTGVVIWNPLFEHAQVRPLLVEQ